MFFASGRGTDGLDPVLLRGGAKRKLSGQRVRGNGYGAEGKDQVLLYQTVTNKKLEEEQYESI